MMFFGRRPTLNKAKIMTKLVENQSDSTLAIAVGSKNSCESNRDTPDGQNRNKNVLLTKQNPNFSALKCFKIKTFHQLLKTTSSFSQSTFQSWIQTSPNFFWKDSNFWNFLKFYQQQLKLFTRVSTFQSFWRNLQIPAFMITFLKLQKFSILNTWRDTCSLKRYWSLQVQKNVPWLIWLL